MFLLKIQKIFCFLMKSKLEYIMFFTFNNGFTSIKFDYSWLHIPDFINRFWKFIPSAMIVIKISKLRHCIAITISFIVEAYLKKLLHILSKCWIILPIPLKSGKLNAAWNWYSMPEMIISGEWRLLMPRYWTHTSKEHCIHNKFKL